MNTTFEPNFAVPPGETLAETLDALGMTQAELAERMGRPLRYLRATLCGDRAAATAARCFLSADHFTRDFERPVAFRVERFVAAWRSATRPVGSFGRPARCRNLVAISAISSGA